MVAVVEYALTIAAAVVVEYAVIVAAAGVVEKLDAAVAILVAV